MTIYGLVESQNFAVYDEQKINKLQRKNGEKLSEFFGFQQSDYAQGYANSRHKEKRKHVKFTKEVEEFVREKLQDDCSPEQISGYAKRHKLLEPIL